MAKRVLKSPAPAKAAAPAAPEKAGEIAMSRVKDVKSARAIYTTYETANRARAKQFASVRNQIEGGRPFDPSVKKRNGESWQTNVNFRDAEASFNRTFLPYWKMVHDVPNKIAVSIESNSPLSSKWEKAFAECFDLFLEDWGADYFFQFMLYSADFVKFGPGYLMFHDKYSPRGQHARTEKVLLPRRAKANVTKWEVFCIEDELSVSDMYLKLRDSKSKNRAEFVGWNSDALKSAIVYCQSSDANRATPDDYTKLQDQIVSNDLFASETWAPLEIIRMFVKNLDGKIASYIFTKVDIPGVEFLFESETYAEDFRHVIAGMFYDVGTGGLVHSIKGFGIKNYYFSILQNRMKSRMMDATTLAMGMNFQKQDDSPDEAPPVQNYSAFNIFPPGLKQVPIYPQLGAVQGIINALAQNSADNNYIYRDSNKDIAETQTARQAVILANLSEEIGSATSSIFLSQVGENVFSEMLRRLFLPGSPDQDAKRFKERLKKRGVPVEKLKWEDIKCKTGANPGTAGAALRDMILKELLGMIHIPGVNARWVLENYIANKLGTQAVSKALLPEGTESAPEQRSLAMIENSVFGQGMQLPVGPSQAHFEHATEHLKPLAQLISFFKQKGQLSPEQLAALQSALPHVAQHMDFLRQDETSAMEYKSIFPVFSQIQSIAQGIFTNLMKQQQAAQQPAA